MCNNIAIVMAGDNLGIYLLIIPSGPKHYKGGGDLGSQTLFKFLIQAFRRLERKYVDIEARSCTNENVVNLFYLCLARRSLKLLSIKYYILCSRLKIFVKFHI